MITLSTSPFLDQLIIGDSLGDGRLAGRPVAKSGKKFGGRSRNRERPSLVVHGGALVAAT
jgi:hypothetical protein